MQNRNRKQISPPPRQEPPPEPQVASKPEPEAVPAPQTEAKDRSKAQAKGGEAAKTETQENGKKAKAAAKIETQTTVEGEDVPETRLRFGPENREETRQNTAETAEKEKTESFANAAGRCGAKTDPAATALVQAAWWHYRWRAGCCSTAYRTMLESAGRGSGRAKYGRGNSGDIKSGRPRTIRRYRRQSKVAQRRLLPLDGGKRTSRNVESALPTLAVTPE